MSVAVKESRCVRLPPRASAILAWVEAHQHELEAIPKVSISLNFAHQYPMKWSITINGEHPVDDKVKMA